MLQQEQIDRLFQFCRQHYIHFYDVQVELVDHLASSIEHAMESRPGLGFGAALEQAYRDLGGYRGMQRIQEERKRSVAKANFRLKWKLFCAYFRWPKAILTVTVTLLVYVLTTQLDGLYLQLLVPAAFIGLLAYELRTIWRFQHRLYRNREQLLLFQDTGSLLFWALIVGAGNTMFGKIFECFTRPLGTVAFDPWYFTIVFPLCLVGLNSYREYLERLYAQAQRLYPEQFAAGS